MSSYLRKLRRTVERERARGNLREGALYVVQVRHEPHCPRGPVCICDPTIDKPRLVAEPTEGIA